MIVFHLLYLPMGFFSFLHHCPAQEKGRGGWRVERSMAIIIIIVIIVTACAARGRSRLCRTVLYRTVLELLAVRGYHSMSLSICYAGLNTGTRIKVREAEKESGGRPCCLGSCLLVLVLLALVLERCTRPLVGTFDGAVEVRSMVQQMGLYLGRRELVCGKGEDKDWGKTLPRCFWLGSFILVEVAIDDRRCWGYGRQGGLGRSWNVALDLSVDGGEEAPAWPGLWKRWRQLLLARLVDVSPSAPPHCATSTFQSRAD